MYILLINDKITYASDNKELLQEIVMDNYFDTEYESWLHYCFRLPDLYDKLNMNRDYIYYHTPQEWWRKFAAPMATSTYEIINLEDYYIE